MFRVYLCNKRLVFDQSRHLLYFSYFINLCCYYPFRKYELKDLLIMSRRLSLNFHGMMKKLGYLTLQNCCYIPSLLSHFHGQCQTVGKKIKTPTILKHLSKKNARSLRRTKMAFLLSIFRCSLIGCTWSCCTKHSPYMVSISKLM